MSEIFQEILVEEDGFGNLNVRTQASETAPPHRRVLAPGRIVNGAWTPTDLSAESQEVKDAAAAAWTGAVIAAYRAQMEKNYLDTPAPPPETSIHKAYFRAALADIGRLADVDAAVTSQGAIKQQLWAGATSIDIIDADVAAVAAALQIDLAAVLARAQQIRAGDRAA